MKKTMLVLNGSHSDIPLIKAAHKLGYQVITSGNNPELIGHNYAEKYINADYSDYEKMLWIAQKENIDAVCACANDFGAITASYIGEKMGLKGHDPFVTTLRLHHKDQFKEFAKKWNIMTPVADSFDTIEAAKRAGREYAFPMIVKPIDLTGGKGISKADDLKEYDQAVETAFERSPSKRIVAEPFIEGSHHSFSSFIVNKKVLAYYSDNEYSYCNPYFVSTSAGPADRVEMYADVLVQQVEKMAEALDLCDGVFHMQYILRGNTPYILECTRRCSGDLYSIPVEYGLNIPWSLMMVSAEAGLDCSNFAKAPQKQNFGGRHCIMGDHNGRVKNVIISEELSGNIYDKLLWWTPGYEIKNYLVDKLGILMLTYGSRDEMLDKTDRLTQLIELIYEN
jgi:biotin carboxylase